MPVGPSRTLIFFPHRDSRWSPTWSLTYRRIDFTYAIILHPTSKTIASPVVGINSCLTANMLYYVYSCSIVERVETSVAIFRPKWLEMTCIIKKVSISKLICIGLNDLEKFQVVSMELADTTGAALFG